MQGDFIDFISTHHEYVFSFIAPALGTFLPFSTTSKSQLFITLEAHPCHFHDLVSPNQGTRCNGRMGSALSAPLIGVIFPQDSTHLSVILTELTISIMGPLLSDIQPFKIWKSKFLFSSKLALESFHFFFYYEYEKELAKKS